MNVEEFTVPPFNLWMYALSDIQKYRNDIVELNRFVEFPHTQHKTRQVIFIWLVVNIGAVTHLRKVIQEDFILACISNMCAEEACLPVNMMNWSC